jgi:hypothetical protein
MTIPALKLVLTGENLPIPKGNKDEIIKQLVKHRKAQASKLAVDKKTSKTI